MRRFLVSVVLAAAGVLVTPAAGWAHAELVSSSPGYGDRLPVAPNEVRLHFSGAVDLTGARLGLQRKGGRLTALGPPAHGGADRRVVSIPLPARLTDGGYSVVWFFLGNDGHLMGGDIPFHVGAPVTAPPASRTLTDAPVPRSAAVQSLGPGIAGPPAEVESVEVAAPAPDGARFTIAVASPQAAVRLFDYASLTVLIGGVFFLARVWADGTRERRALRLLWGALIVSAVTTLLGFGLTAAGLSGAGALDALRPSVIAGVLGTRYSRIMTIRALCLGLGSVVLAMLTLGRDRAVRSRWWQALAGTAAGGVAATHALLGHVSNEGLAARAAVFVHVVGVAVWLGGLVFLAAVVLPRRRIDEVRLVLPRFSRLAFTAVSATVLAGGVMVLRVVPKVSELPQTAYGRMLLVKLALVGLLLVAAQQARTFTERRLVKDSTRMRPLLTSVGAELGLAVVILTSTAVLVGRVPPSERILPLVRAGSAGAEEHTNEIKGLAFNPEEMTIRAGDSITWVNQDSDRHRLSGDGIESRELPNRGSFTAQFPEPAQLAYRCTIHTYMEGRIIVLNPDGSTPPSTAGEPEAPPAPSTSTSSTRPPGPLDGLPLER